MFLYIDKMIDDNDELIQLLDRARTTNKETHEYYQLVEDTINYIQEYLYIRINKEIQQDLQASELSE